jgi:hypothetical protein
MIICFYDDSVIHRDMCIYEYFLDRIFFVIQYTVYISIKSIVKKRKEEKKIFVNWNSKEKGCANFSYTYMLDLF